jgi:hypothetical protein
MAKTKRNGLSRVSNGLRWRQIDNTTYGNQRWETLDGMFRIVHVTQCDGIPMQRAYVLWQYIKGSWHSVAELRSRRAIEKIAAHRADELESDEL